MRAILAVSGPLAVIAAWFAAFGPQSLGGPAAYISVVGASMEPTLHTGDLVWVRRQADYRVGDVVAFRAETGLVIHRIVAGNSSDGYEMQGDNRKTVDPWHPTHDQVLGKMLAHVPGLAARLQSLREGPMFVAFAGLTVAAVAVPGAEVMRRRRRGGGRPVQLQGSARATTERPNRLLQHLPERANQEESAARTAASSRVPTGPVCSGPLSEAPLPIVLALVAALLAVYAFRQPLTQSSLQPRVQFTQTGTFDYSIDVAPAAIYPRGSVGPLPGADGKDAAASEQAVYTRLAQAINVDYRYTLESSEPSKLRGSIRAELEVRAAEGWTKTETLTPPTAFVGPEVNASARIDMRALRALLEQIEQETGFEARSYDVIVKPVVSIEGHVGAEAVRETFTSSLPVRLDSTRITPHGALRLSVPTERADLVTAPLTIGIGARRATVEQVRVASLGLVLTLGSLTALLASVIFLGLGRGEEEKIRARYGSLLLHVQAAQDDTVRDRVRVVSMRDLARLARRDGGLIIEETERLGPRYSVRDGDTVYEFVPTGREHRQRFAEFVARRDAEPRAVGGHD